MASTRHLADAEAEAPSTGALLEYQLNEMVSQKIQSLCISLAWPQSLVPGSGGLMAEMPSNLTCWGAMVARAIVQRPSAIGRLLRRARHLRNLQRHQMAFGSFCSIPLQYDLVP